jgi:phage terminase large subunit
MELATPTYDFNKKDQIWLESKDDIKQRLQGVGSPDEADALALTFASPVHKKDLYSKQGSMSREYDPFART